MTSEPTPAPVDLDEPICYSDGEKRERRALGLPASEPSPRGILGRQAPPGRTLIRKRIITAPEVLNEASEYGSAFPRGLRVDFPNGITHLLISGTASVGAEGQTLYPADFRAQCWRTYRNITQLLASEGASWRDVVRTTCYLADFRSYDDFNAVRNAFYAEEGLDPFPASTCVEARICRPELLVEIEAIAIIPRDRTR